MTFTLIIVALVALALTAWLLVIPVDLVIGSYRALHRGAWKDYRQHR